MTNYRKSMMESLAEVRGLQEDNMDMMRKAAGGAMQTIKMKDGKLQMDSFTASAIMQVYDKVNPANQKKMAKMINDGKKSGIMKLQDFAMKQVKSEYEPQLDEKTKWKMGDGRPRGGSHIENVRFWDLSKDELQYIMKDAGEAMKANPTARKATSGPGNWADQVNDAQTVLAWRKKNGIKEEVDLDEGKFERDMVTAKGISLQIRIIVTARNMIDDGKSDSEIMKTTKLSAGDVKKLRQDMSDRPGEYDEEAELEEGKMKELHGYIAQGKSAEWIAKKMKVDVEAIKTLMAGYNESYEIGTNEYRGHCEKVTPGEGLDEANYEIKNGKIHISKANFRKVHKDYKNSTKGKERMMALDPKSGATTSYEVVFEAVDPADVDDNATDADRAAASKNIIHQLRKSIDQDGRFAVTFGDNKKVKVDAKIAKAINDKFMSIKRPPDKVKFQAQAAKSYKDMLKVLKNGFNEEIQKETILDRIDRKLKERKNG